jgi:hypothetical protein
MSAYASMNLPELLSHRDQISAEIFRQTGDASVIPIAAGASNSGGKGKLTKTGKVRKPSANKGKPTARGDFTKKITAERADDFAAYKEANPDLKGPHLSWYKHYIDEHKEEYEAFKAAWALEHPKEDAAEGASEGAEDSPAEGAAAEAKPKKVLSPEHLAKMKAGREAKLAEKKAAKDLLEAAAKADGPISLAPLVEDAPAAPLAAPAPVKLKGPKKVTKKTAAPLEPAAEPAAPLEPAAVPAEAEAEAGPEELPFKHNGVTYIRIGIQKADGNHIWASTDIWHSKKGKRASYAGELMEDGSINEDAEEPSLV